MLDLTGANVAVVDLETEVSADAIPTGWEDKAALGLSIGSWFFYKDMTLHWFDKHNLVEAMQYWVDNGTLLVSYNGQSFDFPLMVTILQRRAEAEVTLLRAHRDDWEGVSAETMLTVHALTTLCEAFTVLAERSYDLLQAIWAADPESKYVHDLNGLDAVAQANGMPAKAMDGATAPRLWAQGRYAEVISYNVADVLKTKALFEMVCHGGGFLRGDGRLIQLPKPTIPR